MNTTKESDHNLRMIITGKLKFLVHRSGVVLTEDEGYIPVDWDNKGYEYFEKGDRKIYTHKMVAMAYLEYDHRNDTYSPKFPTHHIVHIDGVVSNNDPSNLKYSNISERGERRSKTHLVQNKMTGEEKIVSNWNSFTDKKLYKIIETYNKDKSVSFSAIKKKTLTCTHYECNEDKESKQIHCKEHCAKLRRIKRSWKKMFNNINYEDDYKELLDEVRLVSLQYGVNDYLNKATKYNQYDVPTGGSITRLDGEIDHSYTDDLGMQRYFMEEIYEDNGNNY